MRTPSPIHPEKYCQLCECTYEEYFSHVSCEDHKEKTNSRSHIYLNMNNKFYQIKAYWSQQPELEKEKELQELKEFELPINQNEDNSEL